LAIRVLAHDELEAWAAAAEIPVINALTAVEHPCQALADVLTVRERLGTLAGVRIGWVGDGTNVLDSLADLASLLGADVVAACPQGYEPASENLTLARDPREAARGADVLVTDIWVSLGQEGERERRSGTRPRIACTCRRRCSRSCSPERRSPRSARAPGGTATLGRGADRSSRGAGPGEALPAGAGERGRRGLLQRRGGRGLRPPRPERGREDHHRRGADDARPPDERQRTDRRRRRRPRPGRGAAAARGGAAAEQPRPLALDPRQPRLPCRL